MMVFVNIVQTMTKHLIIGGLGRLLMVFQSIQQLPMLKYVLILNVTSIEESRQ